jgi:hypothetical protein
MFQRTGLIIDVDFEHLKKEEDWPKLRKIILSADLRSEEKKEVWYHLIEGFTRAPLEIKSDLLTLYMANASAAYSPLFPLLFAEVMKLYTSNPEMYWQIQRPFFRDRVFQMNTVPKALGLDSPVSPEKIYFTIPEYPGEVMLECKNSKWSTYLQVPSPKLPQEMGKELEQRLSLSMIYHRTITLYPDFWKFGELDSSSTIRTTHKPVELLSDYGISYEKRRHGFTTST